MLETVFLDAGGVLVFPNWIRISDALKTRGVHVDPAALARAEPHAKKTIDVPQTITATNDAGRGWLYFNLILEHAGVPLRPEVEAVLQELHVYHQTSNLWEFVPESVFPALAALRQRGLKLTVVSNANGKLRVLFERLALAGCVDCLLDSHDEGVEKPDPRFSRSHWHAAARGVTARFTSATCITLTSQAPEQQGCVGSCSTRRVCIRTWIVRGFDRCRS